MNDRSENNRDNFAVKVGLAEMLKGGAIMDVTNADQAKVAEEAGAVAVMALERIPSDIRKMGGLKKYIPTTYWTFLVAALAISGIPIFAGFFS